MNDQALFLHKSVLVDEVLAYLDPQPGKVYLDVTFGSGGHTRAILEKEPQAKVIALDWDSTSLDTYSPAFKEEFGERVTFIWGNFSHIYKLLKKVGVTTVDGILADFGTSQMHIVQREGFSLYRDTPLDMRMSPAHHYYTAAHILNSASEEKLIKIFWDLGGERHSRKIAHAIVQDRARKRFKRTKQLTDLIERVVGFSSFDRKKIHPATQVFQALRMYVNSELENISAFLSAVPSQLSLNGRIVCISFHSLEDVLVKDFFKDQERLGILQSLNKKVVVGSEEEIKMNPSARSAKLRAAVRLK